MKNRVTVNKESQKVDMIFNVRQKRISDVFKMHDTIRYAVIEGSSVTLLGLVKYDASQDKFVMPELF